MNSLWTREILQKVCRRRASSTLTMNPIGSRIWRWRRWHRLLNFHRWGLLPVPDDTFFVAFPVNRLNHSQALSVDTNGVSWAGDDEIIDKPATHLQFHVAVLEVFFFHPEAQSEDSLLESLAAGLYSLVLLDVFGAGVLAVDEPRQLHRRLWPARCAVNVDSVVDLISCTTARDSRIGFG